MPGPAHTGWTHKRTTGDPDEVARWVPVARKVLGFAIQQAQFNGLLTYKVEKRLENGVLLIGELIGGLPRYTIEVPPRPQQPRRPRILDDFVVWARDADHLGGIDEEFPQQILRLQDGSWKTFFYSASTEGHEDFPRSKGTYIEMFPDGVRYAGNVDWESAKGEIISWYGPSARYWPDAWVQPRQQLGKIVCMLGAKLLDTEQYALDSEEQTHGPDRYITGAALKNTEDGDWLYTVQSEALNTTLPAGPHRMDDMPVVGCPYSRQDNVGGIYRYALVRELDEAGVPRYRVVANSREQLADLEGNHAEPWFFNQSCTVAHCYELPGNGWFCRSQFADEPEPLDPPLSIINPDPSQVFREALFDEEGGCTMETTTLSVAVPGPPVHFVADYKGDERVFGYVLDLTRTEIPGYAEGPGAGYPYGPVGFDIAGVQFWQLPSSGALAFFPNPHGWLGAYFAFADLRRDILVLRVDYPNQFVPPGSVRRINAMEVYRNGLRLYTSLDDENRPFSGMPQAGYSFQLHFATGRTTAPAFAPYFYLYGVTVIPVFQPVTDDYTTLVYGGNSAGFCWSPYPFAAYVGYTAGWNDLDWSANLLTLASMAPAGFQGNAADFDGNYSVLGCAATDDALVFSGYLPAAELDLEQTAWTGTYSAHYVTGSTLQELTGVAGDFARYHPVWRLGKPPLTP